MLRSDPMASEVTRRAGANFPHLVVARRAKFPDIRRFSLLDLGKIGSQRRRLSSANRP